MRPRRSLVVLGIAGMAVGSTLLGTAVRAGGGTSWSWKGCADNVHLCTEVADAKTAFGHYVGHDEPSVLFYSNQPGSGNHMQWNVTLPTEPKGAFSDSKGYTAEVTPAFWFGMAMCATQSYPEQSSTCTPDSDSNIINPNQPNSYKNAPGAAYMELQFYPPGFAPQFSGFSCDATQWCAALTIDSLAEDPINGTTLNPACTSMVSSIEYVNFAYLTTNGTPNGPPNPLDFQFIQSGDPHAPGNHTLFMNQGDNLSVRLTDTANGLMTSVRDNTTGRTGYMVASAANHFGQILYAPTGSSCTEQDYSFHPMYATSTPDTRVLWAAHGYNIAFDSEIGHFDFCSHIDANTGLCDGLEGVPGDQEAADGDDYGCFADIENSNPSYMPPDHQAAGYCLATNDPGFDGVSYQNYWPNGSSRNPTPILFSSPLTGDGFNTPYPQADFQADLPRIEASDLGGSCNRLTGAGCTNPPVTDDGTPVAFYPYFSTVRTGGEGRQNGRDSGSCAWGVGSTLPHTISNYGGVKQYGSLYYLYYWAFGGHGATVYQTDNYDSGAFSNPCSGSPGGQGGGGH